jgi:hypothetical protein
MSTYGIRPHRYDPYHTQAALRMTFELTELNRPAVELAFDMCLECKSLTVATCECHERGYN